MRRALKGVYSMFDRSALGRASRLIQECNARDLRLVAVETSTAGMLCGLLTLVPGASRVVDFGVALYSNQAKTEFFGAPRAVFMEHGSVSEAAVAALAWRGLAVASTASLAIATSGVEGPGGGTREKPVGLVYVAAAMRGRPVCTARLLIEGADRATIRMRSVVGAIDVALQLVSTPGEAP